MAVGTNASSRGFDTTTEDSLVPTFWSLGHGARPTEDFVATLRDAGIRRLVDVRTAPGSRKHPQFGRTELEAAVQGKGIAYVWRKDLGGFRRPRPDSPHRALRSDSFRGYADYMESPEFDDALRWLIQTADLPTAFMCAETLWWRCHRRMIADALTARGHDVVHLLGSGRWESHRLHPAARLEGARVVYDLVDPTLLSGDAAT
jgi:uncharacterized protein (DUF488 family)